MEHWKIDHQREDFDIQKTMMEHHIFGRPTPSHQAAHED